MNYFEAREIKHRARASGVQADLMGVPPRPGESRNANQSSFVVFWLDGIDHEFRDKDAADGWLAQHLRQQSA